MGIAHLKSNQETGKNTGVIANNLLFIYSKR